MTSPPPALLSSLIDDDHAHCGAFHALCVPIDTRISVVVYDEYASQVVYGEAVDLCRHGVLERPAHELNAVLPAQNVLQIPAFYEGLRRSELSSLPRSHGYPDNKFTMLS